MTDSASKATLRDRPAKSKGSERRDAKARRERKTGSHRSPLRNALPVSALKIPASENTRRGNAEARRDAGRWNTKRDGDMEMKSRESRVDFAVHLHNLPYPPISFSYTQALTSGSMGIARGRGTFSSSPCERSSWRTALKKND